MCEIARGDTNPPIRGGLVKLGSFEEALFAVDRFKKIAMYEKGPRLIGGKQLFSLTSQMFLLERKGAIGTSVSLSSVKRPPPEKR